MVKVARSSRPPLWSAVSFVAGVLAFFSAFPCGEVGAQPRSGVQSTAEALPTVVQQGQTNVSRMIGPVGFSASFGKPTRRHDLLAVSVVCGVITGGMKAPAISLPSGWHDGVTHIGGILGGLEAAVYYYPDNPGGVTTFATGSVPEGTEAYCTTFWSELAGASKVGRVDTSGVADSDGSSSLGVATVSSTHHAGDLVFLASTDGSEVPDNVYALPPGYEALGQQNAGHQYQPGTFSMRVARTEGVQGGTISWDGGSTDSCAVVVALAD